VSDIVKAFYNDSYGHRHWYLLLDEYPDYRYESRPVEPDAVSYIRPQNETLYWAEVGPFVKSYVHSPGSSNAFGGREINIPMKDGTTRTFKGDLWDSGQWLANPNSKGVGIGSVEQLTKCYVFFGGSHIDNDFFERWLDENPDKIAPYKQGALA
jgi:hypothetical protein